MEISGFGMINPEDYRLSSSRALRGPQSFEDILRRASVNNVDNNIDSNNNDSDNSLGNIEGTRPSRSAIDRDDKLYQLCLELETFLVKNLLNSMRSTVQKSGLIEESFAGKMYEDMLYDEYAKDFTRNAGFGLAEQAYRQLRGM